MFWTAFGGIARQSNHLKPQNKKPQEIISKRTISSKTFDNGDGTYRTEILAGARHYKDEQGIWQEIDKTIVGTSDENGFDYKNEKNNFKTDFKKKATGNFLKYSVGDSRVEYKLEDNPDLGNVREVNGNVSKNTITYPGVYEGVDLKYSLGSDKLLEEYIVRSASTAAKIRRLEQKLSLKGLTYQEKKDGSIYFYDEKDPSIALFNLPKPVMYELDEREDPQNEAPSRFENYGLHYKITKTGNNIFISKVLDKEGKDWLADKARVYPVVIDATANLLSTTSDGEINVTNGATYAAARDAASGSVVDTTTTGKIGQKTQGPKYNVYRFFVFFDSSSIPAGSSISAATLSLYGSTDDSNADFDITISNGQPTYPTDPLTGTDFAITNYSGNGGSLNTSGFSTGAYNDITMNATGLTWINIGAGATTKLAILSSEDINNSAPTGKENIIVSTAEATGNEPKLDVTYTTSSPTLTQASYRLQNDDGTTVNNNTNQAAADISRSNVKKGERINARIQLENTGVASADNKVYKLQYDKNDSVWNDVGSGGDIRPSFGLSGTNADAITSAIAATNTNTWTNGTWHENTNVTNSFSLTNGYYTEFGFLVDTSAATLSTTYRLRLYNNTDAAPLDNYDQYPTITIVDSSNDTTKYSKEDSTTLATDDSDLTYFLDDQGYTDVGTDDSARDPIASSNYPVFLFKKKHTNNTDLISINWDGQASVAASTNTVYLQMYNYSTSSWVEVNTNTSAAADTDFSMNYTRSEGPSDFYDGNNWIAARVYQASGAQTLRTDLFDVTFGAQSVSLTIEGVDSAQTLEGITTDISTLGDPYTLNFGSLPISTSQEAATKFTISSNGYGGYTLTTRQDQDLTSGALDTISTVSGTNASPSAWPGAVTTGAFGYHTSDDSLGTGTTNRFLADDTYAAFSTTAYEIGYSGVAVTSDIVNLVYRIEVGTDQAGGSYSNIITYDLTGLF